MIVCNDLKCSKSKALASGYLCETAIFKLCMAVLHRLHILLFVLSKRGSVFNVSGCPMLTPHPLLRSQLQALKKVSSKKDLLLL